MMMYVTVTVTVGGVTDSNKLDPLRSLVNLFEPDLMLKGSPTVSLSAKYGLCRKGDFICINLVQMNRYTKGSCPIFPISGRLDM